jgi:hypothetical protein
LSINTVNYPTPVTVNGYSCKNCTDVDNAKKHVDPQHPKSGPYGINAKNDPSIQRQTSVIFSGALSELAGGDARNRSGTTTPLRYQAGNQLNLSI